MNILILGAGPAGLALGNRLKENGIETFTILEKEAEAGGLCRTRIVDGQAIDIGGPHFLDDRDPEVNDYLFRFMPEDEWTVYDRKSRILMKDGQIIGNPIEAFIWQFDKETQLDYLESISAAGCNSGVPKPDKYIDWIYWKLGKMIADNYMLPYNSKLFGRNINDMGTYWLYKLPSVSFRETIKSCLDHKFYGTHAGAQSVFYYNPKLGYGEVWRRMANELKEHIRFNSDVNYIDFGSRTVGLSTGEKYSADLVITTIPWACFNCIDGAPQSLLDKLSTLKYRSLEVRYVNEEIETDGQWVYCPDERLPFHRATILKSLDKEAHGMMIEASEERVSLYGDTYTANYAYMNQYAYPVHTVGKPQIMEEWLAFAKGKGVHATGRWGEHMHHNSNVVVRLSIDLADKIEKGEEL